ncbi:MAG TPA: ABC transporter substrate-binding protein [Hyphomicrobiales bacterium]|jgi:NitT/TauT family transport system substrate-binding protein
MARLKWTAAAAMGALAVGFSAASAADVKEINFVEAVHNLGYINLYVGQHAGIFEKNGVKLKLSAAGGDTQAFAAVLGKSSPFAIGDATMVQMSREAGGPGIVVGTVIQRAHYFGVSKNLPVLTDAKQFKGLTVVTSPDPNTNFSVTKKLLLDNGLKPQIDTKILEVNPGTEIAAMLAGQADMAVAYQPSVSAAESQGAKIVFDFAKYVGPFCNTGIMVLPDYAKENPDIVQAVVTSFEEAGRLVYSDPAYAKKIARLEFPDMPGDVVDKAIDAEIKFKIPAETVVTQPDEWNNLMAMQKFLGNVKYSIPMDKVIDNSYADKAVKEAKNVKAPQ